MSILRPLICLLVGAYCASLYAQSGIVRSGNQPIPGATVTATQDGKTFVAVTGEDGYYSFPSLGEGVWTVEVQMFGFEPVKQQVNYAKERVANFSLKLRESPMAARLARMGANGQGGNQLETELQSEINSNQSLASAMPGGGTQDGNEAFLISGSLSQGLQQNAAPDSGFAFRMGFPGGPQDGTGPGPNGPGGGGFGGPGGPGGFGGPGGGGGFGGPGGGGPGGGFGGRGGGGGGFGGPGGRRGPGGPQQARQFGNRRQPSAVHGMFYFTLGNSDLNAKPFSLTGQDVTQPAYAAARFGLVLGGPLLIPKVVKDTKTTFFVNFFGTRAKNPTTEVATVPTEAERDGNFSESIQSTGSPVQIFDPTTHLPFPGNIIPSSMISPIAHSLLEYIPFPNQAGQVNNYELLYSVPQNSNNGSIRIQRNVSPNDRLSFRFAGQSRDGDNVQTYGFLDAASGYGISTNAGWTHNFTPHVINTFQVTFNRNVNETTPYFADGANVAAELGILGASTNPLSFGPPNLNFTNFGALSDASPVLTRNQTQGFTNSLVWAHGVHTLTWGVLFNRNDTSNQTEQNGRGTFNFTGQATSELVNGVPVAGTGLDFADFLLGLPQSASIQYGNFSTYFRQTTVAPYVMDDWKIRPSLTLDLGLRYEYFTPLSEEYGHMANLDIGPYFTAVAPVVAGGTGPYTGQFPAGLINPDYRDISPRLGLAWKVPHIKRSTIVRAGYGIYYNGQAYIPFGLELAEQPPFATAESVNTSLANPLTLATGFISVTPRDITNTYAVNRYYRTPDAQTWNLTVQHELPHNFFAEIGYLGTKGTDLDVQLLPNEGPSSFGRSHQIGNAVGFTFDNSVGDSIYHALQLRVNRRFSGGISMQAFYTFSKSIDDSSSFGGAGNTVAQNWLDLAAERGLSSFNRPQVLTFNWIYTSPFGTPTSRIAADSKGGRLLRDWQLSGGLTAESGTPLTARVLGNTAVLAQTGGIGSGRAEATGESIESATGFFNLAAFTIPPEGEFGNAGRNTIPGPDLIALNATFGRSFQFGESRRRLELRLEANNVLNTVSLTNVYTVVNATNYGLPSAASAMRSLTAVMRFRF